MEPIVSSETSAIRTQTPGNYPKRDKLHLEHGESLKTRMIPVITMRTPEGISAAQVKGFTSQNVARYFNIYESELRKVNHSVLMKQGLQLCNTGTVNLSARWAKNEVASLTSAVLSPVFTPREHTSHHQSCS